MFRGYGNKRRNSRIYIVLIRHADTALPLFKHSPSWDARWNSQDIVADFQYQPASKLSVKLPRHYKYFSQDLSSGKEKFTS